MMEEDKAIYQQLKEQRNRLEDQNRDMEFEAIMLEEASKNEQAREK